MASKIYHDIRKKLLRQSVIFETIIEWNCQLEFIRDTKWSIRNGSDKNLTDPLPSDIPSELNHFTPGMRFEAIDRIHPQDVCVASVLRVVEDDVLVFLDGWSNAYNYWCRYDSPEIRPVGTAQRLKMPLCPPSSTSPDSSFNPNWKYGGCNWKGYLEEIGEKAAPDNIFGKLIIPEGSDKYSELAEKKDGHKPSVMENGMLSLYENCARVVVKGKINYSKCPVQIRERLCGARRCIVCGDPFLVGFHGILPWTSVEWIQAKPFSRMSILCSLKCAEDFVSYKFPFDGRKKHSQLCNRRYYSLHRTLYKSEHKKLSIQTSTAESEGFYY